MNAVTSRMGMFPSRTDAWHQVRAFIEGFCRGSGTSRETCLKACLVVEELFMNTVKHGHRGGSDAPVWLRLTCEDGRIWLAYEDQASPFNPFAPARREMLEALMQSRREGGLGVLLANGLTASAEYAYVFGRNRIRLQLTA